MPGNNSSDDSPRNMTNEISLNDMSIIRNDNFSGNISDAFHVNITYDFTENRNFDSPSERLSITSPHQRTHSNDVSSTDESCINDLSNSRLTITPLL